MAGHFLGHPALERTLQRDFLEGSSVLLVAGPSPSFRRCQTTNELCSDRICLAKLEFGGRLPSGLNNWRNPSMKRLEFGDYSEFSSVMHEHSTISEGVAIVVNVTLLLTKVVGLVFRAARAPAPPLLHPSLAQKLGHRGRNLIENYGAQTCALEAKLQTSPRRKITQTSKTVWLEAYRFYHESERAAVNIDPRSFPDTEPIFQQDLSCVSRWPHKPITFCCGRGCVAHSGQWKYRKHAKEGLKTAFLGLQNPPSC